MKKKIEAELIRLAEEIRSNKGNSDIAQLKEHARQLYEKLCVLAFTKKYLEESPETSSPSASPARETSKPEKPDSDDFFAPDGTEYNDTEAITEPATEKIKDIVAQMPPESERVDNLFQQASPKAPGKPAESRPNPEPKKPEPEKKKTEPEKNDKKKDFRHIGVDYDNLPDFEPLNNRQKDNRPKSLNDRLKKGINIGLNERLSFIKHLFDGNTADYNRVLSQLNTFSSMDEAHKFIQKVVKPDYNNWEGKEDYEQRFMEVVENKFSNN